MRATCPKCRGKDLVQFLSEEAVRMESLLRAQFVFDRLDNVPRAGERKDLTSFAHGAAARILECPRCSILMRRERETEPVRAYVEDEYDPEVMKAHLPAYSDAFRAREEPYRSLLAPGAQVLEVGPHFGAFMIVAREWGWNPVGVDVGRDTAQFVSSQGFEVRNNTLEGCRFPEHSFDGIFVWNCFEQIPDPRSFLAEARRVVKSGGPIVLRTPNALVYRVCQRKLRESPESELSLWIVRLLGYNNLLAFPYLYGYESESQIALAAEYGLSKQAGLNSELIALPFPQVQDWVIEENRAALALARAWSELEAHEREGRLTGPWIEITYRAS